MVADDLSGVGPRVLADIQPVGDVVPLGLGVGEGPRERELEDLDERGDGREPEVLLELVEVGVEPARVALVALYEGGSSHPTSRV